MKQNCLLIHISSLLGFLLLFSFSGFSQNVILRHYDESIFVISNYSGIDASTKEKRSVQQLLDQNIGGFRFYIRWEKQQNQLMLRHARGYSTPLKDELVRIRQHLESKPDKILTLFLDFNVNINELITLFDESGLSPFLYEPDEKPEWPTLTEMVETGKRLVVFGMQEHRNSPDWIHYIWNHAVEPYFSIFETPDFIGEFLKGDHKNSLLIYNDFNLPLRQNRIDESFFDLTQNPYLIEHVKNIWMNTGKTPNFIMLDSYQSWILNVLYTLRSFKTIKGTVSFNSEILSYVSWEGTNSLTSGNFCFPVGPGESMTLTPRSPGYRFKPESVTFDEPERSQVQHFTATSVEITENLEAYYNFENGAKDYSINNFNGKEIGMQYISDPDRDLVAKFDGEGYIVLPKAEELKIRDHDFTVSAWVKIENYQEEKSDYCILGTSSNTYQQGLHLNIRNKKPYFGFFANDLQGKTRIQAKRWHHIVWRYNKLTGEQAIFVDGRLDSRSLGHPSYKGRENIYIGLAYAPNTAMIGLIDNLTIWSRTLSEEEIWSLSREVVELIPSRNIFVRFPLLTRMGTILLSLAILFFIYWKLPLRSYRKHFISREKLKELEQTESDYPEKNYLQLFGDFKAVDKNGEDITNQFTPKLKQLFLLILAHSQQNKKGISTRELSEILWSGMSYQNAKNSRGVTIRKLRIILQSFEDVEIIFNIDCWTINFSKSVYCDYVECLNLLNEYKDSLPGFYLDFYKIIRAGEVFKGESHFWLDDYKGYIGNNIVDILIKFINKLDIDKDNELILKLADRILVTDPVNDQAISFKLKALICQDNLNTAKFTYEKFATLYEQMYNEKLALTFDDLIKT